MANFTLRTSRFFRDISSKQKKLRHHYENRLLFGLLLLIFVQYPCLFDGQEKINQSVLKLNQLAGLRKD